MQQPPRAFVHRPLQLQPYYSRQHRSQGLPNPDGFPPAGPPCEIPGCRAQPEPGSPYCSDEHRKIAVVTGLAEACILCKEYPRTVHLFCGDTCKDKAHDEAPLLISVDQEDPRFADISNQFKTSWRHTNKTLPTVQFVYKIVQTKELSQKYLDYRKKVEAEGNFMAQQSSEGNERRRWHGTRRGCLIGDDPTDPKLCALPTCALCLILRMSFQVERTGRTFARFGTGIYASPTSSKSDEYSSNIATSANKAILLTTVIVGRAYKATQNNPTLTEPPRGYHSVLGETGQLMHGDEVAVYDNDAIRPSWLVVYK